MAKPSTNVDRANAFVLDQGVISIIGSKTTMRILKSDALRLAMVCLMAQNKYAMVPRAAYQKDLKELAALRKLTETKKR